MLDCHPWVFFSASCGMFNASLLPLEAIVSYLSPQPPLQAMVPFYKSCGRQLSFFGVTRNGEKHRLASRFTADKADSDITYRRRVFYITLCCSNSCLSTVAKEDPRAAIHFQRTRFRRTLLTRSLVTERTKNARSDWPAGYLDRT